MLRLLLSVAALFGAVFAQNSSLPEVDLGYEVYRAADFNVSMSWSIIELFTNKKQSTGNFYNFPNIRYAASPIGDLRFAPPQAPTENRSSIIITDSTPRYAHDCISTTFSQQY